MTTSQSDASQKQTRKKRKCAIVTIVDLIHEIFSSKHRLIRKAECLKNTNPEAAKSLQMRIIKRFGGY